MASDRGGNSFKTATRLGNPLASPKSRRDEVGLADKNDLYTFGLGSRSHFNLKLTNQGKTSRLGLQLFSLKGTKAALLRAIGRQDLSDLKPKDLRKFLTPVTSIAVGQKQTRLLDLNLDAGEYYVRVAHRQGKTSKYRFTVSADPIATLDPATPPAPTSTSSLMQKWVKQIGGGGNDYAYSTTGDGAGNIYVTGVIGANDGSTGNGFVAKYNSDGTQEWQRSLAIDNSIGFDIAVDSSGNYYIAGARNISATGTLGLPSSDGFLAKYNSNGTQQWIKTIATTFSVGPVTLPAIDAASGLAIDAAGNILVTGFLHITNSDPGNAFIDKYDANGNAVMSFDGDGRLEFGGTGADAAAKIAVDSANNIYIAGITNASIDTSNSNQPFVGGDGFVAAYSQTGTALWSNTTTLQSAAQDYARDLVVSGDSVYVTGQTAGTLNSNQPNAGSTDGFLVKYNKNDGAFQWLQQFGGSGAEESQGIAVDSTGNIYLTGETTTAWFAGGQQVGGTDPWIAVYNNSGSLLTGVQFGTAQDDEAYGITVQGSSLYTVGQTQGAISNSPNQGRYDAWIARYE